MKVKAAKPAKYSKDSTTDAKSAVDLMLIFVSTVYAEFASESSLIRAKSLV